jgi:5-methylcytosine-specific restriction endonuclease McrBC GTP-binding regulatory subunit McrB
MADNLERNKLNISESKNDNFEKDFRINQIQELKNILEQMHGIEERAVDLIAKLENKE